MDWARQKKCPLWVCRDGGTAACENGSVRQCETQLRPGRSYRLDIQESRMQPKLLARLHEAVTTCFALESQAFRDRIHQALDALERDTDFLRLIQPRSVALSESARAELKRERAALASYPDEHFVIVGLTAGGEIGCRLEFCDNHPSQVEVDVERAVQVLRAHECVAWKDLHNHPGGGSEPSGTDERLYRRIKAALSAASLIHFDSEVVQAWPSEPVETGMESPWHARQREYEAQPDWFKKATIALSWGAGR
jgi:RadC-like JAB domain